MNRPILLLCTALLGAGCDERMKTPEATPRQTRPLTPTNEQPMAKQAVQPDNTGVNSRDRGDTVTPMDQGNTSAETAITADIRKGVMAESSLSITAKNVKVMTVGSHVTLRGPVPTAAEKTLIAAVAMRTSGVSDVDNQLEVEPQGQGAP
jgi:hyperosmotically inducible periplasmic protein